MRAPCEACVLAGGLSSRIDRDKARLRLGGKSLLARVQAAAIQAGLPVRVIRRDLVPRCGPLGGVYTALRTTEADADLFLSCDMPFVTGPFLTAVLSKLEPGIQAVFVARERMEFPFVIRRTALGQVERMLAKSEFSLQALARELGAVAMRVPRAQEIALFNINCPAEYLEAQELWRKLHS